MAECLYILLAPNFGVISGGRPVDASEVVIHNTITEPGIHNNRLEEQFIWYADRFKKLNEGGVLVYECTDIFRAFSCNTPVTRAPVRLEPDFAFGDDKRDQSPYKGFDPRDLLDVAGNAVDFIEYANMVMLHTVQAAVFIVPVPPFILLELRIARNRKVMYKFISFVVRQELLNIFI